MLNCFYTNDELLGMNLKGANSKPHPQKDILEGIYLFKQSHVLLVLYSIYVYINSASLPFMIRCMITSGNGDDTC